MHYRLTTLDNGLRVISETMPDVRSVAIGCWVDTGTRDELANEAGASHFLEHLLFKGTEELSARDISETFDAMGAQSNAFTTKEATCFWARLLDNDLATGMELLGEMLQHPAFRANEIDSERQVVIEEINMNEDDPGDVSHEEFFQAVFQGHPLERPVLGTRESILGMTRDDIAGYWKRRYGAGSAVVAIAGSVEHDRAVEMVAERFGGWDGASVPHEVGKPNVEPRVRVVHRDTEQAHLVIGGESIDRTDERRWAADVLNHILGGGMSSRLFRVVREERGLAYAIYSFRMPSADTGAWGVYVGTTPEQTSTVLRLIREEIDAVADQGVTAEELERAKGHMRGSLALSLEDANNRMIRLGRAELAGLPHLSVDERLERIEAVTLDDVRAVGGEVLHGPRVIGACGPFEVSELEPYTL